MDAEIKKFCPNCSQLYHLKCTAPYLKGTLPVFLTCGHTICEGCVKNILKFAEPIECKVCKQTTEINPNDAPGLVQNNKEFYQKFPVNLFLLGELTMNLIHDGNAKKDDDGNYFVDLKSIIQTTDYTTGYCIECHQLTTKMCQQCEMILCDACFNKSHKNFVMFKNHILKNIEPLNSCNKCKIHTDKTLDYYCKDCSKSICMDCFMVGGDKSCKNHDVTSMKEVNEGFLEDLSVMFPKVDETYRRLTKSAVDVGNLLYNLEHETGTASEVTQMIANLEQHFSKLSWIVQRHKNDIVQMVSQQKHLEKQSLYKAKEEITHSIKKAKEVLNLMSQSLNPKKLKQINLAVVLDDAKQIAETPWCLKKNKSNNENFSVTVKEEVCNQINEYVKLEGEAQSCYSLCTTTELGDVEIPPPPPAPVYPPEMPKDVRQHPHHQQRQRQEKVVKAQTHHQGPLHLHGPMFRSKTRSTSSLNSMDSDGSSGNNGSTRYYEPHPHQRPFVDPVTPYVNKVQKQLHKGCQEVIYISHIVDPHNFYVQRACHQGLIKELFYEFRNAVSSPKPSAAHITEGKLYLMLNKRDGTWQRCRIVSVERKNPNKPTYTVYCIDFGSTEVVSIENLRLLQPARVQSPPPLAINCSLANCVPKSGAWTSDDSYLIQNIINNKQAVIYVRDIRQYGNSEMLVCDVTTIENGVSLAHALEFHERARLVNPKLHYPKIHGLAEKPKLFMVNNNLKLNANEEVNITHIVSPDKFYVRELHLKDVYEKLCEELEMEYNTALPGNNECVYLPEVGMVCVVNMEKYRDGEGPAWARGVVLELPGRARARVLLADTGADRLVHSSALRPPRDRLTTLRALATECHLAGVTPLNKKWSAASVALLQRYQDTVLELHVEDNRNRGSLGVILYDKTGEDVVCVNNEMIKYKFAISFGFNVNNKNEETLIDKSPMEHHNKPAKKRPSQITILQKEKPLEVKEDNLEAKDKGPLRLEVSVLQYQSPSLVYVSMVHQQSTFALMFEELQKKYSTQNSPSDKSDWKEGDRCCAFNEKSKTWRRAVIMEVEGENAKVFYSDFALVDTVPLSGLRELIPQFNSLGDAAIKCHLSGVMPAVGTEWPSLTKEYLKELLEAYKRVFITKMGNFKEKSMPVELWVYHTVQGGALEPDTSEWRCLNKKIIEQGLGVPDKSQEVPAAESENGKKEDDEMLSFLNVTGSVREWLLLEPPTAPAAPESVDDNQTAPSTPDPCDLPGTSKTHFISDWVPPEPLPCTEFIGVPTYIDNDGVVFLHQLSQLDTLDLISKALEVRFRKPDPKAKHMKWTVGEPCIALYFLDNRFYRGRVIEVNTEASTCFVQYVDYGNEEVCSFENMRKGVVLHQIPVQAHKCFLSRIRPTGNQWDRTTLDYIHKSIVEKQCLVKIVGKPVGDLVPIELNYDKLCINDHLVDFEMAEYTDGSKPVVTKFVPDPVFKKHEDLKSDSGPDFIVDDLSPPPRESSFDPKFDVAYDWNLLVEEENETNITKNVTFMINDTEEFLSNVTMINDHESLELNIIHKDEDNILYEEMLEDVKKGSAALRPLCGIFENKACVALFPEDGQWYRASILKQNKTKNLVKVRYVDYGNTEVVSISDVREIDTNWLKLPPASIQIQFYNAKINPHCDVTKLFNTLSESGPLQTKIVCYENSIAQVELRNQNGELVNDKLIRSGHLI